MDNQILALNHIKKSFPTKNGFIDALVDISLNVSKGESLAIVGESGAGKSTLLSIIGLLQSYDAGKYEIDGRIVKTLSDRERAKFRNQFFGFILQDYGLIEYLNVFQNVEIPLLYSDQKLTKKERRERVEVLLDQFGLKNKIDQKATSLSGGEKQRVAVCRALICEPKIILADEPTAALDEKNKWDMIELMLDMKKRKSNTLIMITHDHEVAERFERVIHIEKGVIV